MDDRADAIAAIVVVAALVMIVVGFWAFVRALRGTEWPAT